MTGDSPVGTAMLPLWVIVLASPAPVAESGEWNHRWPEKTEYADPIVTRAMEAVRAGIASLLLQAHTGRAALCCGQSWRFLRGDPPPVHSARSPFPPA